MFQLMGNTSGMPRSPLRLLADNLLSEGVDTFVSTRRAAGKSWRAVALDLRDTTKGQIDVAPETVRGWYRAADTKVAA